MGSKRPATGLNSRPHACPPIIVLVRSICRVVPTARVQTRHARTRSRPQLGGFEVGMGPVARVGGRSQGACAPNIQAEEAHVPSAHERTNTIEQAKSSRRSAGCSCAGCWGLPPRARSDTIEAFGSKSRRIRPRTSGTEMSTGLACTPVRAFGAAPHRLALFPAPHPGGRRGAGAPLSDIPCHHNRFNSRAKPAAPQQPNAIWGCQCSDERLWDRSGWPAGWVARCCPTRRSNCPIITQSTRVGTLSPVQTRSPKKRAAFPAFRCTSMH